MKTSVGGNMKALYQYTTNAIGQRTERKVGGPFLGKPATPELEWTWGYNAKGEVTKADHATNTTFNESYQFDGIGNRLNSTTHDTATSASSAAAYTPNSLNQIQSILKNSVNSVRTHDDDGNLTNGALPVDPANNAKLTWNGENRLTEVHALTEGADPSLSTSYYLLSTYQYDCKRLIRRLWS